MGILDADNAEGKEARPLQKKRADMECTGGTEACGRRWV